MKKLLVLSLALFATPLIAKADFVVDNFGGGTVGNAAGAPRAAGGGTVAEVYAGALIGGGQLLSNVPSTSTASINPSFNGMLPLVSLVYDFTPVNGVLPFNPGENFLLVRSVSYTAGVGATPASLVATFVTASASNVLQSQAITLGLADGLTNQDLYVDITGLSNIGDTRAVSLSFFGGPGATSSIGSLEFTSAPEPASLALTGLAVTAIGGVVAARRRKSSAFALA